MFVNRMSLSCSSCDVDMFGLAQTCTVFSKAGNSVKMMGFVSSLPVNYSLEGDTRARAHTHTHTHTCACVLSIGEKVRVSNIVITLSG